MRSEFTQLCKDYAHIFSCPEGQRVLDDLRKALGDRLSYTKGDPYETAYREGERTVYLRIVNLIEYAKRPERLTTVEGEEEEPE